MQFKTVDIKEVLLVDGDAALARLIPVEPPQQQRILGLHAHLGTA